jgi:hypothetical protein
MNLVNWNRKTGIDVSELPQRFLWPADDPSWRTVISPMNSPKEPKIAGRFGERSKFIAG